MIVTVGAVLSTSYVFSFVPVGVVSASALPAVSTMFWALANDSVTVPSRPARSPSDAVTSYCADEPGTAATPSGAVVPSTSKSVASTFSMSSSNVTSQVRLVRVRLRRSVGIPDVQWDVTSGAVVSDDVTSMVIV